MKIRYRLGREGFFRKEVLILQVWTSWPAIPDSFGGDYRMSGEGWRDATVEDFSQLATQSKYPPESLTWLYTHCRAIGMDCKSDSGKWEHDIALFTSNQKTQNEFHLQQLDAANTLIKKYREETTTLRQHQKDQS